jgi:DinB family protein
MDAIVDRLERAGRSLTELGPAVEAGEPWPLSDAYGTEPEADWGPKETLAHVAEMVPFWLAQIEFVLGGEPATAVPFGRVATDPARLERIGRDRHLPAAELLAAIDRSVVATAARLRELSPADGARRGLHVRLGEMTVEGIVERFLAGHLEEHDRQLREILAARSGSGASD